MLHVIHDFVFIAEHFCTKTFPNQNQLWVIENIHRIASELNGVATQFNWRMFSSMSWAVIAVHVIPTKVYLCEVQSRQF